MDARASAATYWSTTRLRRPDCAAWWWDSIRDIIPAGSRSWRRVRLCGVSRDCAVRVLPRVHAFFPVFVTFFVSPPPAVFMHLGMTVHLFNRLTCTPMVVSERARARTCRTRARTCSTLALSTVFDWSLRGTVCGGDAYVCVCVWLHVCECVCVRMYVCEQVCVFMCVMCV